MDSCTKFVVDNASIVFEHPPLAVRVMQRLLQISIYTYMNIYIIRSHLKYLHPNFISDSKIHKYFISFLCINSSFPTLNMSKEKEAGSARFSHITIQIFKTEIHQKLFPSFCLFVALELIRSSTRLNLTGIWSPRCIKSCRNVLKCWQHPWTIPSAKLKKYALRGLVLILNTNEKLQE